MAQELELTTQQSTDLVEYRPSDGLIKRGLQDATRTLRPQPSILYVPTDYITLQHAVDFANEGDAIEILSGEYEENVVIQKDLTIRAHSGLVQFRARDEAKPLFRVDMQDGRLTIENIIFVGKSGKGGTKSTSALRIVNGQVLTKHCQFANWDSWDYMKDEYEAYEGTGDYSEESKYWAPIFANSPRTTIAVMGPTSLLAAHHCRFSKCESGVDVFEGAQANISGCSFTDVETYVVVNHGTVVSRKNTIVNGCFTSVGKNSIIDSKYDTLIDRSVILHSSNSSGSTVTFDHATVCSGGLLGVAIGKQLVHPNRDGQWVWIPSRIVIIDSIIYLTSDGLEIRYAADTLPEWDISDFESSWDNSKLWDLIEFRGKNLVDAAPEFPSGDPKFGDIVDGQLSLKADSPAIGAACDGTNLGAWQGGVK